MHVRLYIPKNYWIFGLFSGTEQYLKLGRTCRESDWKAAEMEMDPSPAFLQRLTEAECEESFCLNAVASSDKT